LLEDLDTRTSLIYQPVKAELVQVEANLQELSQGRGDNLSDLLAYLFDKGGKGLRPAVTLLASRVHSNGSSKAIVMATAVELLHIATLIHDDTVDNSPLRRGKETISSRWGRNVAVLLGDYVFATSALFVCDTGNVQVIRRFSETIMELSSGQLMEYFNSHNWKVDRKAYQERIYRKTASLFLTAAESGAILGGADKKSAQALSAYGYNIGMAFQIVDDILDIRGDTHQIGKPVGNDLLQGVLTLPAIMLLERYPAENPIKNLFDNRGDHECLRQALEMIQNTNIIDACYAEAEGYCDRARESIAGLPETPAAGSLRDLTRYVTERQK
jgi:geranylgeranyl pyrophosphate synthase